MYRLCCNIDTSSTPVKITYVLFDGTSNIIEYKSINLIYKRSRSVSPNTILPILSKSSVVYLESSNFSNFVLRRISVSLFVDFTKIPFVNYSYPLPQCKDLYCLEFKFQ